MKIRNIAGALLLAAALSAMVGTAHVHAQPAACCDLIISVSPLVACNVDISSITFTSGNNAPGVTYLPGALTRLVRPCPDQPIAATILTSKKPVTVPFGALNMTVQISPTCCVKVSFYLLENDPTQCYTLRINPC